MDNKQDTRLVEYFDGPHQLMHGTRVMWCKTFFAGTQVAAHDPGVSLLIFFF